MKRVLLLGGLDPSGGAGITLDATVVALHGAQPLPIALVTTAQNRRGFQAFSPVPEWRRALIAVLDDGPVEAIKVGLLGDAELAAAVAQALRPLRGKVPILIDPVLSATAGGFLPHEQLLVAYREQLLPLASLLLPNALELDALFGGSVQAALRCGAAAVLQKGGHHDGPFADDVLWTTAGSLRFRRQRLPVGPVRGTGCALGAAIVARLALGSDLASACGGSGDWLAERLQSLGPASSNLPRTLPFAVVQPGGQFSRAPANIDASSGP